MRRFSANRLLATAKSFLLFFTFLFVITKAQSQTTLAAGDLAFVGYISTDDGVNGATQDDEFSFILLKDITTGTIIKFTDFGWLTATGFQTANPCGPNTGAINDGIITWTATTNMTCGTEVRIKCKYTLQATSGTVAGTQACNNDPAAYLSLANGGDQIFAYQGTHASPTFIAGISINKAWDAALVNCFFSSNSSVLPAALASGANNVAVTGGINAKYNCAVTNELPANVLAAINNTAYWSLDNTFFPPIPVAFQLPLNCSFSCTPGPNISPTVATGTITACQGSASVNPNIQQFTVSGSLLTTDILVTAPVNFEVSTSIGSGYGSSLTLTQSGGTVALTTIYVRSAASAPAGPISGNVVLTSSGAATKNVAVSGTINPLPGVTNPVNTTACVGGTAIFTSTITGTPTPTIQWRISSTPLVDGIQGSGSTVSGATTATLTITNVQPGDASASYNVQATNICGTTTSANASLTVNAVTGGTVATDQTICSGGDPAAFTETVASTGSGALTYQWQSSTISCAAGFTNIAGATATTYDAPTGLTVTTYYRRVTTSTLNAVACTANSNCITATVNSVTGGTVAADQTICSAGDPALFTQSVASTGTALTYQWQSSTTSCATGFSDIAGATGTTYDVPSGLTVTTYYRRVTTSTLNAVACTANSNCITVTVNNVTGGTVGSDQTLLSPADPAAFTEIGASTGSGTLTYQWQSSTTSCAAGFTNIAGATATTYDAPAGLTVTTYYRRVTTSTLNAVACTANSNCITVTVFTCTVPTITCPGNISLNNTSGLCGRVVTYTTTVTGIPAPTVTYSFSGATVGSGAGDGSGSFFNVGVTNVTITAANNCGSPNCSFTVTITDNQSPTVTTGTIVSCYPTVAAAQAAALAATSATDNCPGVITETASTVGTCSAVVTVTETDANGNSASTSYNTRIDNTPPTVTVGTIANCYPTVAAAEAAALAATSATDNCPGALAETASTVGTCSAVITVTTTDGCGNATAITYNTRIDNTAPTVTVGTIGSCYPTVAAAEAAALAATSATDNCPGALVETASTVGTCSAVITVTTTDGCGNATAVTYNTRIDNTAPTVTVGTIGSCYPTVAAAEAAALAATSATDNCPGALVETASTVGTCSAVITVTTTDGCGNTTAVTYNTRIDNTAPTLTCPAPVTVSCAAAVPVPSIASVIGVTDNCPGAITVTHQGDVISNQTCANRYTITRTYRATDGCGNFAECTQIITVNDITPPVLTCPAPVTVSCAANVPAPNIASVTGVSDNCAGAVTVTFISDVISNQTCANRYTVTRTYRATDVCGNFAECTQIITVNDQTAPVITCPAPITVSCASAVPAPNIALVTATDNCAGAVAISHISDVISNQTCANRFTLTRTYRATDVCGNFSQCTQIITVNDQTPPVITCPAIITVNTPVGSCTAVVNFTVTATDNCGTVTVVSIPASGSVFQLGTTTVTSTATDACGMTATCTFTVTVNDVQLPVITAQPVNRTVCVGTTAVFSVTAITSPSANGPLNYQWQSWNGSAWVDISGATASTLTLPNVTHSMNTNSYRVRVIGLCTTIISNPASLYVNPLPIVSISPSGSTTLLPTQNVTLTAVVSPGGGTYQWFKNNVLIPGATSSSLGPLGVFDVGAYKVTYTDLNGCVSTSADVLVKVQESSNIYVYPNPNAGQFHIRFYNTTAQKINVLVYDYLGQKIFDKKYPVPLPTYSIVDVDLGKRLAIGSYLVMVLDENNRRLGVKWISVGRE